MEKLKEKIIVEFELNTEEQEELKELTTLEEIKAYLKEIY